MITQDDIDAMCDDLDGIVDEFLDREGYKLYDLWIDAGVPPKTVMAEIVRRATVQRNTDKL